MERQAEKEVVGDGNFKEMFIQGQFELRMQKLINSQN